MIRMIWFPLLATPRSDDLEKAPPEKSPYFSVLLDSQNRRINHHEVAIDGPVLHRDKVNPDLVHVYLLSYERQASSPTSSSV